MCPLRVCLLPPIIHCRHTKLVTLKPKYMIENQTGLHMLMKQYGAADPDLESFDATRFARVLPPGSRCATCGWAGGHSSVPLGQVGLVYSRGRHPGRVLCYATHLIYLPAFPACLRACRAAVYWDDAELARELVVRPAPLGEEDDWHWSGECPRQTVRHTCQAT
jgi:hypothetical protein